MAGNLQGNSEAPMNSRDHVLVDPDGGAVHFKPLKKSDEGDYKCKASNDVGFVEGTGNLRVIGMFGVSIRLCMNIQGCSYGAELSPIQISARISWTILWAISPKFFKSYS